MKTYLVILLISVSFAHLEGGIDKEVGPYVLDIGWEPTTPSAGEAAFFAINIVDKDDFEPANFSSAWVRFSKGDRVAFAGTFAMKNGSTSFSFEFPEAGAWEMKVQFGEYSETTEVFVPGEKADTEMVAWLVAAVFAVSTAFLYLRIGKKL